MASSTPKPAPHHNMSATAWLSPWLEHVSAGLEISAASWQARDTHKAPYITPAQGISLIFLPLPATHPSHPTSQLVQELSLPMAKSLHKQVKAGTERLSKASSAALPGELRGQKRRQTAASKLESCSPNNQLHPLPALFKGTSLTVIAGQTSAAFYRAVCSPSPHFSPYLAVLINTLWS